MFFEWCKQFSHNHRTEVLELLTVYDIIMKLGESLYFVPSLLPSTLSFELTDDNMALNFNSSTTVTPDTENHHQNVEPLLHDDVDDQSSGEYHEPSYITTLVSRLSDNSQYKKTSPELHHSCEKSYTYLTIEHHNTLPTGNNFYNISLLDSVSFQKSADLSYATHESHLTAPKVEKGNSMFYPSLFRIWLSSFIPDGFWPRLLQMMVSDNEIREVVLKLIPASQHSSKYSLWNLWQSGIAIIYKKTTWLELRNEANCILEDGELINQYRNYRIFLSIYTMKFIELHENSSNTDCYLSCETVLRLSTKLLVLIEQLILELEEWFPGTLEHTVFGDVESYIPCCHCMYQEQVAIQFNYTKHIALYHNDLQRNVFWFGFEQLLHLYSKNESPVCQHHGKFSIEVCAPDIVSALW